MYYFGHILIIQRHEPHSRTAFTISVSNTNKHMTQTDGGIEIRGDLLMYFIEIAPVQKSFYSKSLV